MIDTGLVWVGPPPSAIAAMGDKLAAKEAMAAAGVPTLPSVRVGDTAEGEVDAERLLAAAADIGFPVLVKASAGGGGKGMRIVRNPADLAAAVAAARREAAGAFGDDTVFLERYLAAPRHVEIQVLADGHGNVVHCFERECSIQRRHQKVIEEAPSPAVSAAVRDQMGQAAVAAASAIGYESAGTVEFLFDEGTGGEGIGAEGTGGDVGTSSDGGDGRDQARFWFLEMNTRLQVEHPVTEAITGLDLVREQIRIASGEPLGYGQADLVDHWTRRGGAAVRGRPSERLPAPDRHRRTVGTSDGDGSVRLGHRDGISGRHGVRPDARQGHRHSADTDRSRPRAGQRARPQPARRRGHQPRLPVYGASQRRIPWRATPPPTSSTGCTSATPAATPRRGEVAEVGDADDSGDAAETDSTGDAGGGLAAQEPAHHPLFIRTAAAAVAMVSQECNRLAATQPRLHVVGIPQQRDAR